jgi:murein L,D-transpeptidase YcbB/YkuD
MAISETMGVKQTPASRMALQQAKNFGLRLTSAYRSASHDKAVGGSGSGDHVQGEAYDFAGAYSSMSKFADWAHSTGMFTQVIFKDKDYRTGRRISGHQDHVHIAWNSNDKTTGGEISMPKTENISNGDEGSLVFAVQGMLATMWKDLREDGKFGDQTESVVKAFQKQAKLTIDGIVGKNTWKALTGVFFSR